VRPYSTVEFAALFVVHVIVALVSVGYPYEIAEIVGPAELSTVTVTGVEVAKLFDVSRATATIEYDPLDVAVVFQLIEYGPEVSSEPIVTPFTLNVTPATATLSDELADRVTVPSIVAPFVGDVSATIGGVVSGTEDVVLQK
jgi:hypothetical protein